MNLSSNLSSSRHGIYYFRWPIPSSRRETRRSIRISLRTRCPDQAATLARYLASCGALIRGTRALTRLRQDEIRRIMESYFRTTLNRFLERMNDTGFSEQSFDAIRQEITFYEHAPDGEDILADAYLDPPTFCSETGVTSEQWDKNLPSLRREWRKGRRDMLSHVLELAERLERYSYDQVPQSTSASPAPLPDASANLGIAVDEFVAEHSRQWAPKTTTQNRAYLRALVAHFGRDRRLGTITKLDASEMKKVLQERPVSRKANPELKGKPLRNAIDVPVQKMISPKTINSHIQMFKMFFDWAERHGYSPHTLFEGMKVPKAKNSESARKPFSKDHTRQLYVELTENPSGLVRKDSHKWGMLLGMFTGARLNEICQLDVADVQQDGKLWFLDITNEGDEKKSVKSEAGKRRVPLHSELLRLGFLEFVESRRSKRRLFHDFSFNQNGGYGRNLGRWCNESFLPKLGIKHQGLVFHSFRHTMVTRLGQASVPEPVIKSIVGHAQSGVTQEVYLREGYTLEQLSDAIGRFQA